MCVQLKKLLGLSNSNYYFCLISNWLIIIFFFSLSFKKKFLLWVWFEVEICEDDEKAGDIFRHTQHIYCTAKSTDWQSTY